MKKFIFSIVLFFSVCCASFSASMNPKVNAVPEEVQENVFKNPKENLPLVVKSLVSSSAGDAEKVKVLHDWICNNIAYNTDVFSGKQGKQDYVTVLKKRKAVCSGYANLMNQMCSLAGIESYGIQGYSKGFGYKGFIKKGQQCDHEWNAVKIGNKYQLIDVTWDAGFVDYKTFVKHYSTDYLYLTPEQFSFSHLPKDESQQFLANPKSAETFVKEPFVPGTFFSYGLSFGKSAPDYSNEISESAKYDFKISRSNTLLASALSSAEQEIQCASWTDRIGAAATAEFDVPDSKNYSAKILARQKGEIKNPFFFSAAEFEGEVIPPAQNLLAQKKISQKEFDFLTASYFAENGRYYFAENLFDSARNNAVTKILKLLGKNTSVFDTVLSFEIKSSAEYKGYGTEKFRFPYGYGGFFETQNTHLISPVCGVLKKSQSYLFSMNTKDFVSAGILYNDEIVPFQKNSKSGNLELEFSVPDDVDRISVFGSKNGKNFAGLYFYTVE